MKSKAPLDKIIRKSRVHFYKPFQIAEILYRHRSGKLPDLSDVESYRRISKQWRDAVSQLLVGRVSTSSARFQDNLFEPNAVTPESIEELGAFNKMNGGMVEAYIYGTFEAKVGKLQRIHDYISEKSEHSFNLEEFIKFFEYEAGLRRSIDKVYEIVVYALFSTIVRALRLEVSLQIGNVDERIINDFGDFIKTVVGLEKGQTSIVTPASLYRVGVTNAADRGLDMWCNFGPAVQVKHLTLNESLIGDISDTVTADKIVIVCRDIEKKSIDMFLGQIGYSDRIQGIVTFSQLVDWYSMCLSEEYKSVLGKNLIRDLEREFKTEFPSFDSLYDFLKSRGYDSINLTGEWAIQSHLVKD